MWERDQEGKRLAREITRLAEKSETEKSSHDRSLEKLKEEIRERYQQELASKT